MPWSLILLFLMGSDGLVLNKKIIGGQNASPRSWPWHAVIKYLNRDYCQGSLITDQWVLTSASCSIMSYLSGSVVHLGVYSMSGFNPNEENRTIEYFLCHKDFNYLSSDNNICLLKLMAPVRFTDYIQPVSLASENSTFYDGDISWVTGFGYNEYFDKPDILQEVVAPVVGTNKCKCLYNYYYYYYYYYYHDFPNTDNLICAGGVDGFNNSFNGDDGAALVTQNSSIWIQSGIVNYLGYFLERPGLYTRVSQYQKWISDRVTGMKPNFVTFISPGNDDVVNYTCPTTETVAPLYDLLFTETIPVTTTMPITDTISVDATKKQMITNSYNGGKKLVFVAHFFSLVVFVLFIHVFVASAGT